MYRKYYSVFFFIIIIFIEMSEGWSTSAVPGVGRAPGRCHLSPPVPEEELQKNKKSKQQKTKQNKTN